MVSPEAMSELHMYRTFVDAVRIPLLANVYSSLRRNGTQQAVVDSMQTRVGLYDCIGYPAFEQRLDAIFSRSESKP